MDEKEGEKRAVAYLRISTGQQDNENQRPDLVRLAKARGLKITKLYEETGSAVKRRKVFDRMRLDAHQGQFDVLLVWSLDRLGRSMTGNLTTVVELNRIGVDVISCKEPWLDTSSPVRDLLIAIFSWVAEQERRRISERTKAGLERARKRGFHIGRPRVSIDLNEATRLRSEGLSLRQVAQKLGVGRTTLHRALSEHEALTMATADACPEKGYAADGGELVEISDAA